MTSFLTFLLLGKALGGGMPLGAFIADHHEMKALTHDPVLGHITTFGGHPVSCAAGMAAFNVLMDEELSKGYSSERIIVQIIAWSIQGSLLIRSSGLWLAVEFDSFETNRKVITESLELGVFVDWFLFASNCMRISPPLTITLPEIEEACKIIVEAIEKQLTMLIHGHSLIFSILIASTNTNHHEEIDVDSYIPISGEQLFCHYRNKVSSPSCIRNFDPGRQVWQNDQSSGLIQNQNERSSIAYRKKDEPF